jgi:hypothetical protein
MSGHDQNAARCGECGEPIDPCDLTFCPADFHHRGAVSDQDEEHEAIGHDPLCLMSAPCPASATWKAFGTNLPSPSAGKHRWTNEEQVQTGGMWCTACRLRCDCEHVRTIRQAGRDEQREADAKIVEGLDATTIDACGDSERAQWINLIDQQETAAAIRGQG